MNVSDESAIGPEDSFDITEEDLLAVTCGLGTDEQNKKVRDALFVTKDERVCRWFEELRAGLRAMDQQFSGGEQRE